MLGLQERRDVLSYSFHILSLEFDSHEERALEVIASLSAVHDNHRLRLYRALAFALMRRHDDAIPLLRQLCVERPRVAEVWMELGVELSLSAAASDHARLRDALAALMSAHRIRPSLPSLSYNIGSLHERLGEYEDAERWLLDATRREKAGIAYKAWANLAMVRQKRGDANGAEEVRFVVVLCVCVCACVVVNVRTFSASDLISFLPLCAFVRLEIVRWRLQKTI